MEVLQFCMIAEKGSCFFAAHFHWVYEGKVFLFLTSLSFLQDLNMQGTKSADVVEYN